MRVDVCVRARACVLADVMSAAGWTEQDGMFVAPAAGNHPNLQLFTAGQPYLSQCVSRALLQVQVPQHRANAAELLA